MEPHRPEPEEHWNNRQFDNHHIQTMNFDNPKEQANHLINIFSQVVNYTSYASPLCLSAAKECAKITVDGLVKESYEMGVSDRYKYWSDVKQALENL